jgi:hypothetical protein
MKKALIALAIVAFIVLIGAKVVADPEVQRIVNPVRRTAAPTPSPAPTYLAQMLADFCAELRSGCVTARTVAGPFTSSYVSGVTVVIATSWVVLQTAERGGVTRDWLWIVYVDPETNTFLGSE